MTTTNAKPRKKSRGLEHHINRVGWLFILPAVALILVLCFYPMIEAFILSLQKGKGNNLSWNGLNNYTRLFKDKVYIQAVGNTFFYLIIQVPIMLVMALLLASMLNDKTLKFKGVFRTLIFLPCATSLVSCSIIFKQIFSPSGLVNTLLLSWGFISEPFPFLTSPMSARIIIIVTMLWRWTGYNMIFYLAGLQNIDYQVYEAARIDGASSVQQFTKITVPLLKPVILMTTVLSTNGTLQLFDEVKNMTKGGPNNATTTISTYIYKLTFEQVPQFGYASALAYTIFIMVAILAFIQMKVGDKE